MGIFSSIGGFLGDLGRTVDSGLAALVRSPIGEKAIGLGVEALAQKLGLRPRAAAATRQVLVSGGGGGPIRRPVITATMLRRPAVGAVGFQTAGLQVPVRGQNGFDVGGAFGLEGAIPGLQAGELFRETVGHRPIRFITSTNPRTGNVEFWEHAGRPVLFTRDLRTCRRVQKIARRARRTMPTASAHRRRTRKRK